MDNRAFPGEWQWPVLRGITVGHCTVVVHTANWPRLSPRTPGKRCLSGFTDCCAIGECELDYTEPLPSLPARRALFMRQIIVAKELGKPLVLHLHVGAGHPISDVMRLSFWVVRTANIGCMSTAILGTWLATSTGSGDSRSVFGIAHKSVQAPGFVDVALPASPGDGVSHAVPRDLMVGITIRWCVTPSRLLSTSWVALKIAAINAQALYQV